MGVTVKFKKLSEGAIIPKYQTEGAAGFDLHAFTGGFKIFIPVGERKLIQTALAAEIPPGYEMQIRSRSGLALKQGIQAHFGTIDSDYRGNIGVILYNHGDKPFVIEQGDRICQAVIKPVEQAEIIEVDELNETERGEGGFGSSGVNS